MGIEMKQKRLAYYITPHGFGHAVRSIEVIRHLLVLAPALEIVIVSTLPEFLVHQSLGDSVPIRRRQLDIGLVQRDSIQFDLSATLERLQSLHDQRDALVADEIHFFKTQEIQTVVCDIPFLPFAAASQAFIPAIGMGNFTWDWIYQAYAAADSRWTPLVDWIRESYHKCHLLLQLPMHGDCSACPHIQDVPLVARRAQRKREETLKILGLGLDQKVYLISFGWLELGETALKRLEEITDAMFLFKHPLSFQFRNGMCLDDHPLSYEDVVAAVDGVITKPGYGIVSDCLAHGTPVIYTDRGFFPEYDILVREMAKHLTTVYISSEDLYAGKWEAAIEELQRQPRVAPTLPCNGAKVCAEIILSYLK
jgi:L-arabinokinase